MTEKAKSFGYAKKVNTKIWYEKPSQNNPYVAEECRLHGYDITELVAKKSFTEVLLLLFLGELPEKSKVELLNKLMVGLINIGPRHPATRNAMIAGCSKAMTAHILPVGMITLGGEKGGSLEVERTVEFILKHSSTPIKEFIEQFSPGKPSSDGSDHIFYPGIGSYYGTRHTVLNNIAQQLVKSPASGQSLKWMSNLIEAIDNPNVGWLTTGLYSAVMCDLGIASRESGALFQLICAPGIVAHGLEQTHKPLSHMPFLEDEQYEHIS